MSAAWQFVTMKYGFAAVKGSFSAMIGTTFSSYARTQNCIASIAASSLATSLLFCAGRSTQLRRRSASS